ncbi:MAG TPA: cupredoxin domain-containing protein [Actinomycetota bacterium]|nr:cupredoxin domain-containing protein [Actinomycetota bacterium]
MKPKRRRAAVAAALACIAAACSSGPPGPVSLPGAVINKGTADVAAAGQNATVTITTGDDWFDPTFVKVAPGARLTVHLVDAGTVTHTFTIDGQHIDVVQDRKGQKDTVTVTMPADGKPVDFYCKYHQSAGMQGAFYTR